MEVAEDVEMESVVGVEKECVVGVEEEYARGEYGVMLLDDARSSVSL